VDVDRFCPDGPAAARHPYRPRILGVGRLAERRGFEDVVRALRLVPQAECVIVGGPPTAELARDPEAHRLREIARGCRVADRVRLLGGVPRDELPGWYRSADVVACAHREPATGLASMEAMACGVPVVATALGGTADTVVEHVTGDLVPPRNPGALGRAMGRLLTDPVRRLGYAAAGLDRARQCYSWERTAGQLLAVYERVSRPSARQMTWALGML
jgi:glycosyltransferase involved in cell wall biosynthesis